ncbi:hypothetical protein METBIDRAFT_11670 [Metschnikowia bicuspidata var. bicuspidata NRRL YB-4993]|uniref:Uncharacterized protein n=1 Tax=Metschnikowia bicuspidata var. bicuspidata NRRL YB-4993 TaxID=869754 RepID=A0A1A0HAS8_9ASCO|nr:hypothetical protein METBIDRAFT_11670 [Metschnikowia bicuspidata var. bicuspidata NRRL YB-4993]OBA21100.1 hypothetical protein METBIDRAFT_11670 [Metschnikowia bicuspidata var. bicuspidata NRRL YB-4993]
MRYSTELRESPARKAIELCWSRCLPKTRHKYLQSTEILGLVRELESFLGIRELLKPEEEQLLRTTLKLKPQLRLFKSECLSFILGLAHFRTLEEFFETRFRITPERLASLVESSLREDPKSTSAADRLGPTGRSSAWFPDVPSQDTGVYDRYIPRSTHLNHPERGGPGDLYKDYQRNSPVSKESWFLRWTRGFGTKDTDKVRFDSSVDEKPSPPQEIGEKSWISRAAGFGKLWLLSLRTATDLQPLRDNRTKDYKEPSSYSGSLSYGITPQERRLQELRLSFADVRSQAKKLEHESSRVAEKSLDQSLTELQAAVRDQARIISRLERERGRSFKTAAPGVISLLYVPWDYFTGFVATFLRDLIEELLPPGCKRSVPEFLVRVLSIVLGFFVIINFFKLLYFVAVIALYSSETAPSYIFYDDEVRELAPLSWLQEFPTLEYWSYQLRDMMGY